MLIWIYNSSNAQQQISQGLEHRNFTERIQQELLQRYAKQDQNPSQFILTINSIKNEKSKIRIASGLRVRGGQITKSLLLKS